MTPLSKIKGLSPVYKFAPPGGGWRYHGTGRRSGALLVQKLAALGKL